MQTRFSRSFPLLLGVLAVGLVGASIAWACTPSGWGFDDPVPRPENSTPPPLAEPPSSPSAPSAAPQPTQVPAAAEPIATTPAERAAPGSSTPTPAVGRRAPAATKAPSGVGREGRSGGVYTPGAGSSQPRPNAAPGVKGRSDATVAGDPRPSRTARGSRAERGDRGHTSTRAASERSATADLTGAFAPLGGPATPGVAPVSTPSSGPEGQLALGLALLGLGLVSLLGAFALPKARRRARTRSGS